jgi:putative exosortase-associated protein (TIGR04073 family)
MKRLMVIVVVCVVAAQPAWAMRTQVHEAAESQQYGRKFGGMIGRGALNIVTSPVDVIVNLVNETKAGPPLIGTLTGIAKGTGCGVLRLGSGAIDLVTFWVPGFNGFPVSDSYEDCLALAPAEAQAVAPVGYPEPTWEEPAPAPVTTPPKEEKPRYTK